MNTTKRLLALVLCVLMAISSLSSFAFAADIYSEESATSDAKGSASALGNIDPLADNVFVLDTTMSRTATEYDLTWLGQSYPALKAYNSKAVEGSKVFRTVANFETFLGKVSVDNPIVLVVNCGSALTVKISATYVTQAYDVVPFTRGTARNGSDWAYNPEFDEKAVALDSLELAKAAEGEFAFYGFKVAEEINDAKRTPGNANITVANCVFESDGAAGAPIFNLANAVNKKDNSDFLTITNFYVKKATNSKAVPVLFNGNLPAHVVIDGLYVPAGVNITGAKNELIQVENVSSFTIKNSNLQGVKMSALEFVGAKAAVTAGQSKAIVFDSNIINGIGESAAIVNFISTNYTSLRFNNNTVINTSAVELANGIGAEASADGMSALEFEVKGNWFNALKNTIKITTGADSANLRNILASIEKNFTNTIYSDDEAAMIGVTLDATEHGFSANSYYTDVAMTKLVDMSLQIVETTADNGEVFFSNAARTIFYIMGYGDATSLKIKFAKEGSTYKIYSDFKCTEEVSLADIKYDDTKAYYYFKSTTEDGSFSSDPYKVTIVRDTASEPYFSKEFSDPNGIIGKGALFADVDSGYVADGRLYVSTWAGKSYTFIKGYDVFESVDAAAVYARANGIENPQYMLKDLNGDKETSNTWQVINPGRYYTEAYTTSPVKKGTALDGSDWAFNEEYRNAGAIKVGKIWFPANGTAGEYEFHGFTLGQYVDKTVRHYEIKVLLNNCFLDVASWSHTNYIFHFDENKAMSAAEKKFEDSLVVKDSFIETNGGSGRYISGTIPAHFVWDGVFLNATAGCFSGQVYCQQFNDVAEYTIRNSLLKNFSTDSYNTYLEGTWNTACAAGTDRRLIFDNNIFSNSYFSAEGIIAGFLGAYTQFQFTNNRVYNPAPKNIFHSLNSWAGNTPLKVVIKNNILNAAASTFNLNGRTPDTTNSEISDNYLTPIYQTGDVTYNGVNITVSNNAIATGNFWYDSAMTKRASDVQPFDFIGKNVIFNATRRTITYVLDGEEDKALTTNHVYDTEDPSIVKTYRYAFNINGIIHNPYLNTIRVNYNDRDYAPTSSIVIVRDTPIEFPIQATINVSSPDGTSPVTSYAVSVVENGPAIKSILVGDKEAVFENGKFFVTLPSRDSNEAVNITTVVEGTEIITELANVALLPGETGEYEIVTKLGEYENKNIISITRELAEYADLDAAVEAANAANSSAWLPVYKKQLETYVKAAEALDRATTEQADVDALTAQINDILANYVERTAIDAKILEIKRIRNNAGKYCDVTYDALQQTALDIEDTIPSLTSQADVDAAITILENAKAALKEHKFSTYVHDAGTENCKENGTMTAKCNTPGCSMTDTKAETGKFTNEDHAYGEYTYNNDATLEADGTKTAICSRCNKATTVTAEGTKLTVLNSTTLFTDVKADAWYKEYVDYVATFGILNGIGNKEFGVNVDMTRAQFVQVLANLAGVDTKNNDVDTKFSDVEKGKWYTAAVKWASDNGVVSGTSATTFAPNAAVDRQQLCVMLVNFAKKFNITVNKKVDKTVFPDDAKIADWAKEAVYTCQQAGVVKGNEKGYFQPTKTATRPEVAVIITVVHQDYLA